MDDALLPPQSSAVALPTAFDHLHVAMIAAGGWDCDEEPYSHVFTPKLYTRTIFMRAGLMILSKIHRTEHPFVIAQGEVEVYEAVEGTMVYCETLKAPHMGVTKPGTQRALKILADTLWSTFHVIEPADYAGIHDVPLAEVEALVIQNLMDRITEPHVNPLLTSPPEPPMQEEEAQFAACLAQAEAIVGQHRAAAPDGCDPQNTAGIIAAVISLIGAGVSYATSSEAAAQQSKLSLLNAQANTQAITQQGQLAAMQATINQQLAANDKQAADANAAALVKQADINTTLDQQNESKARDDFRRLMAAQRVGAAQSGVLDTTGSPYDLLLDTATKEQQQIDNLSYQSEQQRRQTLAASVDAKNQGIMAEINGLSQQSKGAAATGGIAQGVAQANLNYYGALASSSAMRNQALGSAISQVGGIAGNAYSSFGRTPASASPSYIGSGTYAYSGGSGRSISDRSYSSYQ